MRMKLNKSLLSLVFAVGAAQPAGSMFPPKANVKNLKRSSFSKNDCRSLIRQQEQQNGIPSGLLEAIGAVESSHSPYAVNCNGQSHLFSDHDEAKNYVIGLRNRGIIDINIGVLQINYGYHQETFKKAEHILDPYKNIPYAAKYLAYLKVYHGSWEKAVKYYHSPVARYQNMYFTKVLNSLKAINMKTYKSFSRPKRVSFKPSKAA